MDTIEVKFHDEMLVIYYTAKKELKYNTTRLLQIVSEKDGLQAAKLLISKTGGHMYLKCCGKISG